MVPHVPTRSSHSAFSRRKRRVGAPRQGVLYATSPRLSLSYHPTLRESRPSHQPVTPKHGSWLNQIEIWFGVVQKRVIRRGNFVSKADLTRRILAYIAYYNEHLARPYRWTYTGEPLAA